MVKKTVQVAVRTRPTASFAHGALSVDVGGKAVEVHLAKDKRQHINNQQEDWSFKFDHLLHNSPQEEVYETCARDIVDSVLQGYNGTVLAYGQTGAGKTFTMCGGAQSYKYRGIIPRAINQIFAHVDEHQEKEFQVRISYLEVYNETFYDLLRDDGGVDTNLAVRDDERGNVVVKGLAQAVVSSEEEALNLLFSGETNRAVAEHNMNKNSTRSHCVFTLHVESRSRVESNERVVVSKLNLVDLAGSERVGKTGTSGALLNEAKYINRSLTFLEQVVIALSDKSRDHVPFRQSKLTNMLRDSLGGNCIARLIANVWAERQHLEETVSTLKFATRMMRVSNDATVNVKLDPQLLLRKYERQIKELRQELAMHDNLADRGGVTYDDYTPEQQADLRQSLERYVAGDAEEPQIESLCQVRESYRQFRAMVREARAEGEAAAAGAQAAAPAASPAPAAAEASPAGDGAAAAAIAGSAAGEAKGEAPAGGFVGDLDDGNAGCTLGVAPRDARPPTSMTAHDTDAPPTEGPEVSFSPPPASAAKSPRAAAPAPRSDAEAFEVFKAGAGAELRQAYDDNRAQLRDTKARVREAGNRVNAAKRSIDGLTQQLNEKRAAAPPPASDDGVQVIDEEEYDLIRRIKAQKSGYKQHFEEWRMAKSEATYLKGLVDRAKHALAEAFVAARDAGEIAGEACDAPASPSTVREGGPSRAATAYGGAGGSAGGSGEDEEDLDDGERFERMEMEKVMQEDPASLSFYNARKNTKAKAKRGPRQMRGHKAFA